MERPQIDQEKNKKNHPPTDHQAKQTRPLHGLTNHHQTSIKLASLNMDY